MSKFVSYSSEWIRDADRRDEIGLDANDNVLLQGVLLGELLTSIVPITWPNRSVSRSSASVPFLPLRPDTGIVEGASEWLSISGIARGSTGTVLSAATIMAFRTSDNVYISSTTSAADGAYSAPVDTTGTHYLVAYKAGSPDIAGVTVNTLTGT